jgi:hypothetical protein
MGDLTRRLTTRLFRGETILFLVLVLVLPASAIAQGTPHRAGLIIRFGEGRVITRCVSFNEPSLTGVELLSRAGLSIRVDTSSSIGAGVCKIGSQGCDQGKSCFCQCEGGTCAYWQYFHLQNGAWQYSNLGAGIYQVADGAVEGWAWGNNVLPPVMTLDQICVSVPSASAPTNAPQGTRAPTGVPTLEPQPATPTVAPMGVSVTPAVIPTTAPTVLPATNIPSATVTPLASPTFMPASSTSTPSFSPSQNTGVPPPVVSYAIFGVIVLGLGAWLIIQAQRKAR